MAGELVLRCVGDQGDHELEQHQGIELVGLGLWRANGWWLVLAPAFVAALDRLAVRREERDLEAHSGEDHRSCRARVRRGL